MCSSGLWSFNITLQTGYSSQPAIAVTPQLCTIWLSPGLCELVLWSLIFLSHWISFCLIICLLVFCISTSSKLKSGRHSSPHSWLYNVAPMEEQATGTMTRYRTHSRYHETELIGHCPILVMLSVNFCISLVWLDRESHSRPSTLENLRSTDSATASGALGVFQLSIVIT